MKTKYSLVLVVTVLIAMSVQSPAIDISIRRSGTQAIISWPQTATNFCLEIATSLDSPTPWYPAADVAAFADGQFSVTSDIASASRFYRLATWDTLFDGTSTAAFRGYQQASFPATNQWIVTTNGELMTVPNGSPRDITTLDQYDDFELFWEWRPVSVTNANSGVFYRVGNTNVAAYRAGPEYQLYDDARGSITNPKCHMGAVYGLIQATNKHLALTGEWSQCRLIVQSNHVQHFLNGQRVVECDFQTARWTNAIQNGTTEVVGNFTLGLARSGYIVLQHHGESVMYRNIKVRRISSE